ncbi:hypothetical protein [Ancylomarina sp.]|uniref:hypothetical protein n=1 Tax=Ancylomarina sp. TaxID=1970196 RepID=UPI003568C5A3
MNKFKNINGLAFYKTYLKNEFSEIRDYLNDTKDLIKSKQEKLSEHISCELKKVSHPDDEQEIIEFHIDDIIKYQDTYIELLMNSTFITTFSLFESSFHRICEYLQNDNQLTLSDFKGIGGIDKYRKYIEKIVELDLTSLNQKWVTIKNYGKVRNLIIHNSANFKKDKSKKLEEQEMYSFITFNPSIQLKTFRKGNFYINDHKFINDFCDIGESYLEEVITKAIEQKRYCHKPNQTNVQ